jgi:hypothetical protein
MEVLDDVLRGLGISELWDIPTIYINVTVAVLVAVPAVVAVAVAVQMEQLGLYCPNW